MVHSELFLNPVDVVEVDVRVQPEIHCRVGTGWLSSKQNMICNVIVCMGTQSKGCCPWKHVRITRRKRIQIML